LGIDYFVHAKFEEAYRAGLTQLTEEAFDLTPVEILNALNDGISSKDEEYISLHKISEEAGIGKTTVHDVLSGRNVKHTDAVKDALNRLAEKKLNTERKVA
ncbi:hypothetical protein GWO43_09030, partial [candidate division KSB1 bacterium]|nr:hypothetical protein [candidate division KSB1 bacterium]NIR73094.1 hypothetical protein [candidate division KSB1 bacterium]NIS24103.1 hypothetical protein [candidate division KSB1 bacterium]NIT71023.1 hypothetical protein [candidate division KSB1 bacterium]NIU24723.1 hypothetical protein [candidate division KSB1 bacterium]